MERNERKSNSRNHSVTMDRESKFYLRKFILDFVILFVVGFLILVFKLWGTPYERGFFCDDESLKHPFKDSTVTNVMLYLIGLGLPVITMLLTEWLRLRDYKGSKVRKFAGKEIQPWVLEAYRVIGIFLFGCACQQLTTDVAKYTIGRLRPYFFEVCKPSIDCNLESNKWKYHENFKCLGADAKLLREMRLSFPSGHSSFSVYTMIFFCFYIQKRFTWRGSKLFRHGFQLLFMLMAWYTVMSRVSDYKHHWSDVLAGSFIGLVYSIIVYAYLLEYRKGRCRSPLANHESELHATNGNSRTATAAGWQV